MGDSSSWWTVAADDVLSGKAALATDEIITALNLPRRKPNSGMAYHAHRNAATLAPICAVAVVVTAAATAAASDGITMRRDLFASADYRTHLTRVLLEHALKQALERAGG